MRLIPSCSSGSSGFLLVICLCLSRGRSWRFWPGIEPGNGAWEWGLGMGPGNGAWEWGWFGRKGAHRARVRHQWAVEGEGERMNRNGMEEMGLAHRKEVREGAANED